VRRLADSGRIDKLLRALGKEAREDTRLYLVGGATMVLNGLRGTTVDVDLRIEPERDELLRAIARLKEELELNVELASPSDFIPVPDGWEERGSYIRRDGRLTTYHYDLYAQALAKVERGHAQDREDVQALLDAGLIDRDEATRAFERIEPELYRYPAVDPATFRRAVEEAFGRSPRG
jgi:Nucleotidyltransferase of unknown function (DUF6036)